MSEKPARGQVVVVTGASGGVGRATAVRFAQDGAKVALIARGRAGLEGAAKEVEQAGGTPYVVQCDVADAHALDDAAGEIERELGPIDVWVNNAMATVYSFFKDIQPEEYQRVTDVTYLGSVWGARTALARFRPRGTGKLIQVGSALGYRGIPLQSAYCGAKHAINGFIDSIRTELMHEGYDGIDVTVVQLPGLNTNQFRWGRNHVGSSPQPVPPIYEPQVAADGIHYATYSGRREVWIGYATAQTVLGNRVSSRVVDTYLAKQGVSGQKASKDLDWEQHDNLFEPADQDHDFGTNGPFSDKAKSTSPYLEANKRRGWLAAAGALAAGAAAIVAATSDGQDSGDRSDSLLSRVLPGRS